MDLDLVRLFDKNRAKIRQALGDETYNSYEELLRIALTSMQDGFDPYGYPNPGNIHVIDDGDYQGTLLLVVPEQAYQPITYWVFRVSYGSCSGCDTLLDINSSVHEPRVTSDQQKDDYMTLILHMIQSAVKV